MKKLISIIEKPQKSHLLNEVCAYLELLGVDILFTETPVCAPGGLLILDRPSVDEVFSVLECLDSKANITVLGEYTQGMSRKDSAKVYCLPNPACEYSHFEMMRYLGYRFGYRIIGNIPTLEPAITADGPEADFAVAAMNRGGSNVSDLKILGDAFFDGILLPKNPERAIEFYKRAEELGDAESAERLGIILRDGAGVTPNPQYALEIFKKYSERNCDWALLRLGEMYGRGIGVPESASRMVQCFMSAAELGSADAACRLARSYWRGIGIGRDRAKAIPLFKKAADRGNAAACYYLGTYYEDSQQSDFNLETAVEYYKLAGDRESRAINNLGGCYLHGHGIKKDEKRAFELFLKAADMGETRACFRVYLCLKNGIGTSIDSELADIYLRTAAAYGHKEAICLLGKEYEEKCMYKSAAECYRISAEGGNTDGQYNIGRCYENGIGVKLDKESAFGWYRLAADNGQKNAQYRLGLSYLQQNGSIYDPIKAFKWFESAATGEDGISDAAYRLGVCMLSGLGTQMNPEMAIRAFVHAAEQGHGDAMTMLGDCYYFGIGTDGNCEMAVDWYRRAAEKRSVYALDMIGRCSENGEGTERNLQEAFKMYKISAMYGDCEGRYDAGRCLCRGIGTEKSVGGGMNYLHHAAYMGSISAILLLGECAEETGNISDAATFYKRAIDAQVRNISDFTGISDGRASLYISADEDAKAEAMFRISRLCIKQKVEGITAPQVYGYLSRAMLSEHEGAAEMLSWIFTHGGNVEEYLASGKDIPAGDSQGTPVLENKKYAEIFNKLGEDYYYGDGIPENRAIAIRCYRIAASNRSIGAQFSYGWCLKNGMEIDRNYIEAVKWLKMSAQSGCAEACYTLGECYAQGLGVNIRNKSEADKWMAKAAKLGYNPSDRERGRR